MESQPLLLLVGLIVVGVLMFLPQFQARRRRDKQLAALEVGQEVMTIGGIIGKVSHIDTDENLARIEIAPGVEMQILLAAISKTRETDEPSATTDGS